MSLLTSRSIIAAVLVSFTSSCTTAFGAQGRPHQVVTPGGALLGAAAVGLIAYGLASSSNNNNCRSNRSSNNGYGRGNYGSNYGNSYGNNYGNNYGNSSYRSSGQHPHRNHW